MYTPEELLQLTPKPVTFNSITNPLRNMKTKIVAFLLALSIAACQQKDDSTTVEKPMKTASFY
jgi:hypothetical protein